MHSFRSVTLVHIWTLIDSCRALLPQADGDKKSRLDAEHKRAESTQKMHLLTSALKKYKNLDVMGDLDDDEDSQLHRERERDTPLKRKFTDGDPS